MLWLRHLTQLTLAEGSKRWWTDVSYLTNIIRGASQNLNTVINKLKKVGLRAASTGKRKSTGILRRGLLLVEGEPINILALAYPDGKTMNVLVEQKESAPPIALEMFQGDRSIPASQLNVVAEGKTWVQFFGTLPVGCSSFDLRVRKNSKYIFLKDASSSDRGHGHIPSSTSWTEGAHWNASFRNKSVHFSLLANTDAIAVKRISPGLGRLVLGLSYSASNGGAPSHVTLQERKNKRQVKLPLPIGNREECVLDGEAVLEQIPHEFEGRTVWDVRVDGSRLRLGESDIVDPRAVQKFGWIKAYANGKYVRMRPYWTLDGFLSLEVKIVSGVSPTRSN